MAQISSIDQPLIPGIPGGLGFTQLFHIFKAYFLFITIIVAITIALTLALLKVVPKTYEASAAIIIDFQSENASGANSLPSNLEASYLATQSDIITSQIVMLKVVERLKLNEDPDIIESYASTAQRGTLNDHIVEGLLKSIELEVDDQSRVIRITYSADDPEQAAAVANGVVDAYIETNRDLAREPAKELAESYKVQLEILRQRVEDAQQQLNQFQQDRKLIDLDEGVSRIDLDKQHLSELTSRMVEAENNWREAMVRVRQMQDAQADGMALANFPEIMNSTVVENIKAKLLELEIAFEEIKGVLGPNHPRYKALVDEIATTTTILEAEVARWSDSIIAEAQIAEQQHLALRAEIERERSKLLEIKKDRGDLQQYIRALASAEQVYNAALGQFDKVLLGSELIRTNVGVVSWAVPPSKHVRPKKLISLIIATFLGGLFGAGLALVIELSNRRVRCKQDLEGVLEAPVLAEMA